MGLGAVIRHLPRWGLLSLEKVEIRALGQIVWAHQMSVEAAAPQEEDICHKHRSHNTINEYSNRLATEKLEKQNREKRQKEEIPP